MQINMDNGGQDYVVPIDDYDGIEHFPEESIGPPTGWEKEDGRVSRGFTSWWRELIAEEMQEMSMRALCKAQYKGNKSCSRCEAYCPGLEQAKQCTCLSFGSCDNDVLNLFVHEGCEAPIREDVEYGSGVKIIRKMKGNSLELLPYPIIIASGAATPVMPSKWCSHVATRNGGVQGRRLLHCGQWWNNIQQRRKGHRRDEQRRPQAGHEVHVVRCRRSLGLGVEHLQTGTHHEI